MTAGVAAGSRIAQHHAAHAQLAPAANPFGKDGWPSPWGAADERGAANYITPTKVVEAVKLIKTGKIYQLGRLYEQGMPLFGSRHYSVTISGGPTGGPLGAAKLVYNDEMLSSEIGNVGTPFDASGTSAHCSAMRSSTTTGSSNRRWVEPMVFRSSASTTPGSSSPAASSST